MFGPIDEVEAVAGQHDIADAQKPAIPKLPRNKKLELTVAPGQYPVVVSDLLDVKTYTVTFTGQSGNVYVVAHGVACGNY